MVLKDFVLIQAWIQLMESVVPEGEGVLLYVCDGGDKVSCEGMHGDRLFSKKSLGWRNVL